MAKDIIFYNLLFVYFKNNSKYLLLNKGTGKNKKGCLFQDSLFLGGEQKYFIII
jgi:hypothetical protein